MQAEINQARITGIFDSHAHFDDERFDEDRDELLNTIHSQGVQFILNATSDMETTRRAVALAEKHPFIYCSAGVHPHEAEKVTEADYAEIERLLSHPRVKAVGEIGLDYYYDHSPREIQQKVFVRQIAIARNAGMPIIIHDRDAHEDVLNIMRAEKLCELGGVLHCYSGSREMAKMVLDMNFHIAIGGPVTFKNARKTVETIEYVPLDKLLVETDCPYLAPEPFRGKRNHSGLLPYIIEKIAEIKGISPQLVADVTRENAKRLFRIES